MDQKKLFRFNDETIQELFGFEDAESEPIERLREYYFKKNTYKRMSPRWRAFATRVQKP